MANNFVYRTIKDPDSGLYGIEDIAGALLYEAQFTYREARRLLACLRADSNLSWDECREYVESRTNVKPKGGTGE